TKDQIEKYGIDTAVVIGCPSNFIGGDEITERIAAGFKQRPRVIAVTAGIPHQPTLSTLEQKLARIVTATGGAYIVQHGIEMLQLARREFDQMAPHTLELCRKYIWPDKSMAEFTLWCRQY